MKKRIITMIMGLIFILNTTNIQVSAGSDDPSSWAEEEVTQALNKDIVPDSLSGSYQNNIKRYEYVLLALELFELNNESVTITKNYPFFDIYGHEYEDEIVKAYNAGIIKGNGDGTFRPDDFINRQEISVLVVNLVKILDNVEEVNTASTYKYSDIGEISNWATGYVNYCYNNKIMNGVGKDNKGIDKIDPKGLATREQAIMLLYRLANNSELFATYDLGTIPVINQDLSGNITEPSTVINDFAKVFGQPLAKELIKVSGMDGVLISKLTENFVSIEFENEGTITMSNYGYGVDMKLSLTDVSLVNRITTFVDLARLVNDSDALTGVVYRDANIFETDVTYGYSQNLSENEAYISYTETEDDVNWFVFSYQYNSN